MNSKSIETNSAELLDQLNSLSVADLEQLVTAHNQWYFVKHSPQITDDAFDKLVLALQLASSNSPVLAQVGAASVGQKDEFGDAVIHRQKMLSLEKCYDDGTFYRWRAKVVGAIIAMPKIDGVACCIRYDSSGKLVSAATRGDGSQGENITQNVLAIADIPRQINITVTDELEVRGEVYMRLSRFREKYADSFANPRNLAAGALKQKNAQRSGDYGLSFFPYDVRGSGLETEKEKFLLLQKLGFIIPDVVELEGSDVQKVYLYYFERRNDLDYEIDGVVFRANEVSEQRRLGDTAHHPRFSLAYKFQGESAQTHVREIQWSIGRTGIITPICVVDPVFVSGANVSRASLHNFGIFKAHGICENTLVEIVRRGGVIPYVQRVLRAQGKAFTAPIACPFCKGRIRVDGDFLYCARPEVCPKVILARVLHFISVVDLQGFGVKLIEQLIAHGLVKKAADLYRLTKDDLLGLERMAEKSSTKLMGEVEAKRRMNLATFLTAVGFEEVGPTVAANIVLNFSTLEKIMAASIEELSSLHGIGPAIAQSLVEGVNIYRDDILALQKEVTIIADTPKIFDARHPFFEKNIVFTGAMKLIERKEAQRRVREVGGKTPTAVSATTHFLVFGGDEKKNGVKINAARKLSEKGANVTVIDEDQFMQMLGNK